MSISFNFGTGAQGTATTKAFSPWAYPTAVRIVSDDGTQAKMTDILAPLDKPTQMKVSLSRIANVYQTLAGGTVPVSEQSSNTSGGTVFAELKTIATKTNAAGVTIQLPLVGRIELRVPHDADITDADIEKLVMATYGILCDATGSPTTIAEKLRGALTPVGI